MTACASTDIATQLACQETVLRFTAHFDAQEYDLMEGYFSADGIWRRLEGDVVGLEGLRQFLASRPPNIFVRHLISNLRTTVLSVGQAQVDSYLVAYRHDFSGPPQLPAPLDSPLLIGRYQDELRQVDGTWKIQVRQVHIDFRRA